MNDCPTNAPLSTGLPDRHLTIMLFRPSLPDRIPQLRASDPACLDQDP